MRLRREHMGRSSTGMGKNAHVRCVAEGFQARLLFDGQVMLQASDSLGCMHCTAFADQIGSRSSAGSLLPCSFGLNCQPRMLCFKLWDAAASAGCCWCCAAARLPLIGLTHSAVTVWLLSAISGYQGKQSYLCYAGINLWLVQKPGCHVTMTKPTVPIAGAHITIEAGSFDGSQPGCPQSCDRVCGGHGRCMAQKKEH